MTRAGEMDANKRAYDVYRTAGFTDTDGAAVSEGYTQILRLLPAEGDTAVLDFGCGGGEFLEYARQQGFTRMRGVDRSREQVDRCKTRGLSDVELVDDSLTWLGGRFQEFGAVVMNDVLEHIPKPDIVLTLEALRRALVPGGVIVVKVPNAANAFGLVARYLDFTHEIAFTEHSLGQVLRIAGFSEVTLCGISMAWRPTVRRTLYLAANKVYQVAHAALYQVAVGSDAPRILTKLLVARGVASP